MARQPNKLRLTPRDLEILRMFADGKREADVCSKLGIGRDRLKEVVADIRDFLGGAETRTHAVAIALRRGLIT